eukprot:2276468-Rhodomonas_salina.1
MVSALSHPAARVTVGREAYVLSLHQSLERRREKARDDRRHQGEDGEPSEEVGEQVLGERPQNVSHDRRQRGLPRPASQQLGAVPRRSKRQDMDPKQPDDDTKQHSRTRTDPTLTRFTSDLNISCAKATQSPCGRNTCVARSASQPQQECAVPGWSDHERPVSVRPALTSSPTLQHLWTSVARSIKAHRKLSVSGGSVSSEHNWHTHHVEDRVGRAKGQDHAGIDRLSPTSRDQNAPGFSSFSGQ